MILKKPLLVTLPYWANSSYSILSRSYVSMTAQQLSHRPASWTTNYGHWSLHVLAQTSHQLDRKNFSRSKRWQHMRCWSTVPFRHELIRITSALPWRCCWSSESLKRATKCTEKERKKIPQNQRVRICKEHFNRVIKLIKWSASRVQCSTGTMEQKRTTGRRDERERRSTRLSKCVHAWTEREREEREREYFTHSVTPDDVLHKWSLHWVLQRVKGQGNTQTHKVFVSRITTLFQCCKAVWNATVCIHQILKDKKKPVMAIDWKAFWFTTYRHKSAIAEREWSSLLSWWSRAWPINAIQLDPEHKWRKHNFKIIIEHMKKQKGAGEGGGDKHHDTSIFFSNHSQRKAKSENLLSAKFACLQTSAQGERAS